LGTKITVDTKNLYRLPFDQYQRYRLVAELVPILEGDGPSLDVLEVGGFPPQMHNFLPDNKITIVDIQNEGAPGYIRAKGTLLPFPDGSFDAAISLDTLEHIPETHRERFIAELCRVAGRFVILAAPFASEAVKSADKAVYKFIKEHASFDHTYLREHIELELPDLVSSMVQIVDKGFDVQIIPSGRLDRWMFLMAAYYALDSDPDLKEAVPLFMEAYNRSFYEFDKAEPAYRHFLVGSLEGLGRRWTMLPELASGESTDNADYRSLSMILELSRTMALKKKDRQIDRLNDVISNKDDEIKALLQNISELEDFHKKVKALPLYGMYEKLLKPRKK